MTDQKQAILLREDIDMSKGKMIAQACHASLKAYRKSGREDRDQWEKQGEKKIALEVSEDEILERFERAKSRGLPAALIKDAGKTEIKPGTKTAVGIGPADESEIDSVTGDLKLIK